MCVRVQYLAIRSYQQFGWRIYSRLAVDFRKKDAQARRRLYLGSNTYLTLLKLDFQFNVRLRCATNGLF